MDLTLQDVACIRGGVAVLHRVSFSLRAGQAMVLHGPNGIGKTTLLRTIAGLQKPGAGRIIVLQDSLAYAAHADGIKATLSVRENLSFWAAIYGSAEIEPAMAALQLDALQSRHAASLSAGQKRRLGLARLLVTGRKIWLLDEPTVSLDAASTALFQAMIARHLGQGGSAIIASHLDLGLPDCTVLDLAAHVPPRTQASTPFDGVTA